MCNVTGRLSTHAEYPRVDARLAFFCFPYRFTDYEAEGDGGHRCVATLLCALKPKCVLSVSHPAKRKCLITDTDQPVTDTFYNQIQIYFY